MPDNNPDPQLEESTQPPSTSFSKFKDEPPIEETPIQPTADTPSDSLPPTTPEDPPLALKSTPPPKPVKTSPFKFVTLIVIIILVLVIGYLGYRFLYGSSSDVPTPTPVATSAPTPTPDPTSSWKSHITSLYRINYPEDIDASILPENTLVLTKYGPTQAENTEFYDGISLTIKPSVLTNQTIIEYVEDKVSSLLSGNEGTTISSAIEEITVAGYPGYTFTADSPLLVYTMIFISPNPTSSSFLEITDSSQDPGNLGFKTTVDEILETIEFQGISSTSYTCPDSEYIDCMPVADGDPDPRCDQVYLDWAMASCPDFLGAAY